jgi:hypothetical protein
VNAITIAIFITQLWLKTYGNEHNIVNGSGNNRQEFVGKKRGVLAHPFEGEV